MHSSNLTKSPKYKSKLTKVNSYDVDFIACILYFYTWSLRESKQK